MSELLILILGLIIGSLISFVMLSYALDKVHSKLNRLEKIALKNSQKLDTIPVATTIYEKRLK